MNPLIPLCNPADDAALMQTEPNGGPCFHNTPPFKEC